MNSGRRVKTMSEKSVKKFPTSFKIEILLKERWEKYLKQTKRTARGLASVLNEGLENFLEKEGF